MKVKHSRCFIELVYICVLNRDKIKTPSIICDVCLSIIEWVGLDFIVMVVREAMVAMTADHFGYDSRLFLVG